MNGWKHWGCNGGGGWRNGWKDGWRVNGRMGGWRVNGRMDGAVDEQVVTSLQEFVFQNTMSRRDILPLLNRLLMATTMFAMMAMMNSNDNDKDEDNIVVSIT